MPADAIEQGGPIPLSMRNDTLTSLAGTMRRRGMTRAEMLAAILEVNAGRCKPPLPEQEVRKIGAPPAHTFIGAKTPTRFAEAIKELAELEDRSMAQMIKRALVDYVSAAVTSARSQMEAVKIIEEVIEEQTRHTHVSEWQQKEIERLRSIREGIDLEAERETYEVYSKFLQRLKVTEK